MSPPPQTPDLTTFKALSFDCYGTLIDDDSGLTSSVHPLLSRLPPTHPYNLDPLQATQRFNNLVHDLWLSSPKMPYPDQLTASYLSLASELGLALPSSSEAEEEAQRIGTAAGRWGAFPDTVEGLRRLGRYYKLIILSNVDKENIRRTVEDQLAGARVDAVYTAEEIGSYKPSLGNFRYLFEHAKTDFGVDWEEGELLHVAVSLTVDHVPAKELGLRSVWISRGGAHGGDRESLGRLEREGKVGFEWQFETIGEFADEVERQFEAKEKKE